MKQEDRQRRWGAYIEEFSRQNRTRPTRLGEIRAGAVMEDYWVEDGLPLAGIGLETKGEGAPLIAIMLGGEGEAERSVTHTVARVRKIRLQLTADDRGDGLEVEDAEGMTTILRFESLSEA